MAEELLYRIDVQGNERSLQELAKIKGELLLVTKSYNELNGQLKAGKISIEQFAKSTAELDARKKSLKVQTDSLNSSIKSEEAQFKGAEGSMIRIAATLGDLRDKYRALTPAERENVAVGGEMLNRIQSLDKEIKKLDADIGNHQRNVGNYKSALGNLAGAVQSGIPGMNSFSSAISTVTTNAGLMATGTGMSRAGMLALGGAVGIGILAIGGLSSSLQEGVKYAMDYQARMERLKFALDGNAKAAQEMSNWASKLSSTSLFKKGDILEAEILALNMGRTEAQSKKMVETAMGMSRALGIDMNTAMMQLSGSFEGALRGMGRYSAQLKDLSKDQLAAGGAVDILHDKFAKFGTEGVDTLEGKMNKYDKTMAAFKRNMATGVLPLLEKAMDLVNRLVGGSSKVTKDYMTGFTETQQQLMTNASTQAGRDAIIAVNDERAKSFYRMWKAATDPTARAQYAKMYDVQLELTAKLKKQNEELTATTYTDPNAAKKAKEDADKAAKEREERERKLADMVKSNNDYITELTRKAIDDQIAAMVDGKDKEIALATDRQQDEVIAINKERRDRIMAIRKTIEDTKAKGEDLKKLQEQERQIAEMANKAIEASHERHQAALVAIEKKYSKTEEDSKITSKYSQDVAKVEEEGRLKLDVLHNYYEQKGVLTKDQLKQEKDEELKIAIDVAQKKYDLLYAEIQARKQLGTISQEEYDTQLKQIATLYGEVKKLGGEQTDNKATAKKKPDAITGGIMSMFNIDESQAGMIKQKAGALLNDVKEMFLSAQSERIQAELKAETKKVDAQAKKELDSLELRRKNGVITEAQYAREKEQIESKTASKKDQLNRKAFEDDKRVKKLSAFMAGSLAVIQMLANPGGVAGVVLSALAAITAGLEIAKIDATKYTGARGGLLVGASHRDGGIKYAMGGNVVELEGNEAVINKRSIQSGDILSVTGTPRQIASRINSYKGYGVSFESGGYTPVSTARLSGASIAGAAAGSAVDDRISQLKVYVTETDISDVQARAKKVKVESTW